MDANSKEKITLISTADSKFYPGLLVALYTALENASGNYDYDVIVLDGGLKKTEIEEMAVLLSALAQRKKISLELLNRPFTLEELKILPVRRGSPLTNARLLVPKLFPELDKAVYLDSDVLCERGIEEFYQNIDDSSAVSACLDPYQKLHSDRTVKTRITPAEYQWPYYNAGVIGMNLAIWREHFHDILDLLSRENEWKHADQSLLNFLFRGRWRQVEPLANICLTLRNCSEAVFLQSHANIHFIGPRKPWMSHESNFHRLTADLLFDKAWQRISTEGMPKKRTVNASSLSSAKRKLFWYQFFQPGRAKLYRDALRQCQKALEATD